jgi:YbgC/YbaW family acyl-CoA thioester hydrolase
MARPPLVREHPARAPGERVSGTAGKLCRHYYRIPFSETDAMGIVHHSNHARYLERGRVEFLRLAGLGYSTVIEKGYHFPLTDIRISYKKPLVFDEVICVETELAELSRLRLTFRYRIYSVPALRPDELVGETLEGRFSVEGETFHCAVNLQNRPAKISEELYERLSQLIISR